MTILSCSFIFFFFNDTATTEIYTLSLHDALPIFQVSALALPVADGVIDKREFRYVAKIVDGKNRLKHRLQSAVRSEEHTSELQSPDHLVCRLLLEKKKR